MKNLKFILISLIVLFFTSCDLPTPQPMKSDSGVKKATAVLKTQANGLTVEQSNVKRRLEEDNMPGSIKHLYVISAMSGQVIIYSTVKGKVTSSGKRLTPTSVAASDDQYSGGMNVRIGGKGYYTSEVLQDDGTYGSSIPYVFWWDVQGRYHQHYVSGGQIIHVSDKPIATKGIILNLENTK